MDGVTVNVIQFDRQADIDAAHNKSLRNIPLSKQEKELIIQDEVNRIVSSLSQITDALKKSGNSTSPLIDICTNLIVIIGTLSK